MDKKLLSALLIVLGILILFNGYNHKVAEDNYIEMISAQQGTCFLDDGSCLHGERSYTNLVIQSILGVLLIGLAIYVYFFDKRQLDVAKSIEETSKNIAKIKETENVNKAFEAFLTTFSNDEQNVLRVVKENEGIQQSTLRFKTDMSKASLSLLLKSLEEKGYIKREPYKKTNKVFLVKKF